MEWIRQGQRAAGDRTPLWLSEFGWTTGTASPWYVSPSTQAADLSTALGMIAAMPGVAGASIYNLRDTSTDPADENGNFGLLTADYIPKPAYGAVQAAMRRLGLRPQRRYAGS